MGYVGTPIDTRNQFQSLQGKRFSGDGSTTAFTLDVAPSSTLDIEVFVGNVRQDPNSAYTLSGTTLTFTGAPPSGTNNIYVVHQAKSVGTIDPPAGATIDMNGVELFLDEDADTSITADTDDQIDFKAGGTDVMSMTATGLTINDGTTITTADNTDTLTLTSTDADANSGPNLRLYRNSSSPADSDVFGQIEFEGRNDNSQDFIATQIKVNSGDVSDGTEDAQIEFDVMTGGTLREYMRMASGSEPNITFNNEAQDIDFVVKNADSPKALFVSGQYASAHITGSNSATKLSYYSSGMGNLQLGIGACINSYDYSVIDGPYIHHNTYIDNGTAKYVAGSHESARYGQYNGTHAFATAGTGSADGNISFTNRFVIANNGDLTGTDTSIGSISDQRLKKDIVDYSYDINKFKQIQPRSFAWKNPEAHTGEATTGFVAQELESVDNDWVYDIEWSESLMESSPKNSEEKALCNNEPKKAAKLGKKDAMYISIIQQLITRIEALEE